MKSDNGENSKVEQASISSKVDIAMRYSFKIIEELLLSEEKKKKSVANVLKNDDFFTSIFICALETTLFIHNSVKPSFEDLIDGLKVSIFEYWKIIQIYIRFDYTLPAPIKFHFSELEIKIISFLAWRRSSPLIKMIEDVEQSAKQNEELIKVENSFSAEDEDASQTTKEGIIFKKYQHLDLFFKRILQHSAERIKQICDSIKIPNHSREMIWETMKHVLSSEINLLYERHLDQIIICSVYSICRLQQASTIKFNQIIQAYIHINSHVSDILHSIYYSVKLDDKEKVDIIKFYNIVYISKMKNFVLSLSKVDPLKSLITQKFLSSLKPKIKMLSPQSPLMENLPPQGLNYTTLYSSKSYMLSPNIAGRVITPRTKALYIFGESPSIALETINEGVEKAAVISKGPEAIKTKLVGRVLDYHQQGENVGCFSHLNESVTFGSKKLFKHF